MGNIQTRQFVDFTNGLHYVDPELNMDPKYLTIARNVEIGYDSSVKKRNGFKLVANCFGYLREGEFIQQVFYFATYCFCYTNQGRVLSVDDSNNIFIEWDEFDAALEQTKKDVPVDVWNSIPSSVGTYSFRICVIIGFTASLIGTCRIPFFVLVVEFTNASPCSPLDIVLSMLMKLKRFG